MTPDMRARVESMLRAGHSDLAIHEVTGAARNTVARYRKNLGLPGYQTREDSPTCRHGHPWPEHRTRDGDGNLRCRECWRVSNQARYQPRPRKPKPSTPRTRKWQPVQPDPIAIERAAAGDPPDRLTPRERHAAIQQLTRWQVPVQTTAERVRCSERTVWRARADAAV